MDRDELIERIGRDLFGYALSGGLPPNELAAQIKPEGLDQNYERYDELVDLHFVLTDEVHSFVRDLPRRLRQLKTETRSQHFTGRGAIQGHVQWDKTFKRRYNKGGGDPALFVCTQREEEVNIPENQVLMEVLQTIESALSNAQTYFIEEADWVKDTWEGENQLREQFLQTIKNNINIRSIERPADKTLPPRTVEGAATSRQPLYREAAQLYQQHQKLRNKNIDGLTDLLRNTAITPSKSTLLELYVLYTLIRILDDVDSFEVGQPTFYPLSRFRDEIAVFDGPQKYHVFYNESGTKLDLSFRPIPEKNNIGEFSRADAVYTFSDIIRRNFYKRSDQLKSTLRPDVFIAAKRTSTDPTNDYLIIEVKDSTSDQKISEGIRELLEYLTFMRKERTPVFNEAPYLGRGVNGILVVQDLPKESSVLSSEEQVNLPIQIIQASELTRELPKILGEFLPPSTSSKDNT